MGSTLPCFNTLAPSSLSYTVDFLCELRSQLLKRGSYCTNHNIPMEKKLTSLLWFLFVKTQSHVAQDSLEHTM